MSSDDRSHEDRKSFIQGWIDFFCRDDEHKVSDFFELMQPEDEFVDDRYTTPEVLEDVARISNGTPHPPVVVEAIRNSEMRVYFGTLLTKKVEFQTCIVDKDLYVWDVDDPSRVEKISEDDYITAVGCGPRNKKVARKKMIAVIVVASGKSVSIIPVTKQRIYVDVKYKERIGFPVTAIAVTNKGEIFLGAATGCIYQLKYELNENLAENLKFNVTMMSSIGSWLLSWVPLIETVGSTAILDIVYDQTTGYMATLDAGSRLEFYQYEKGKLRSVGSYKAVEERPGRSSPERVVAVKAIPYGYSKVSRFVAFTNYGSRHIIGETQQQEEELGLIKKRAGPSYFDDREVIAAGFTLNYFIFVCKDSIVVTKPLVDAHRFCPSISPEEEITIFQLPSNCLTFSTGEHALASVQSKFFHNEMIWQHLVQPGSGYLVTAAATHIVNFSTPADTLARMTTDSKGQLTQEVWKWMDAHRQYSECIATLVLVGARSSAHKDHALQILTQFDLKESYNWRPVHFRGAEDLSYVCAGFILRFARMLSPIWSSCLFKLNSSSQYEVNDVFTDLPDNITDRIEKVLEIMEITVRNDHLDLLAEDQASRQRTEEEIKRTQERRNEEKKVVERLADYMRCIIQFLRFIKIIEAQKGTVIHDTVVELERNSSTSYSILVEKAFCEKEIQEYSLALRDFGATMFHIPGGPQRGDKLALKLGNECPLFFCEADLKINDQRDKLKKLLTMDVSAGEKERCLKEAKNIFLSYLQQLKTEWDLHTDTLIGICREICATFQKFKYFEGIIEVALQFAHSLDPSNRGLQWYKDACFSCAGGGRIDDSEGSEVCDRDYRCYSLAFDILDDPVAFDLILKTHDELFHIFVYKELLDRSEKDERQRERLVSVTTPYIVDFLERCWMIAWKDDQNEESRRAKSKDLLWQYYARHSEYGTAAKRLIRLAKEHSSWKLDKRIEQLTKAAVFARASGFTATLREAQFAIRQATIQQEYAARTPGADAESQLMSEQDLFTKCCRQKEWDLVLQLLSFCEVDVSDKTHVISQAWANYFVDQLWNHVIPNVVDYMYDLISKIGSNNPVCDPAILVPLLEEYRLNRSQSVSWLIGMLLNCGIQKQLLLQQYLKMLSARDFTDSAVKCDFIFAVALLLDKGATMPSKYKPMVDEYRRYYFRANRGDDAEENRWEIVARNLVPTKL